MSAGKKKRSGGIAFAALFVDDGGKRRALKALADPRTPPELRAELERYLAGPLKAATEDMQQLLDERAKFRGRPRPESAAKSHIREQLAAHPELAHRPTALRQFCDYTIVGAMSKEVFGNTVAAIISHT